MSLYSFGSGLLFATPLNGLGPSFQFGTLQNVSVDFDQDIKSLYGSYDSPDVAARGKLNIKIQAELGLIDVKMFNAIYHGGAVTTGMRLLALNETLSPSGTTATAAHVSDTNYASGSFQDLTVRYAASGALLTNIGTGTPSAGQYTVAAGVYTFSSVDSGAQMLISYQYALTGATAGTTITRNALVMGSTYYFQMFLAKQFNGFQSNMRFFRAMCGSLNRATKTDDFEVPKMQFTVFNDPAGRLFELYDNSY